MLSLSCKAGIKAATYIGSKLHTGERSGIKEIAEDIGENEHTVGKILQKLVKNGIIKSAKGPKGGFYVTPEQITLPIIKIVQAIDGEDVFKQCGLGLSQCSETHPCPFHNDFKGVRDLFKKVCEQKRFVDLCIDVTDGKAFLLG